VWSETKRHAVQSFLLEHNLVYDIVSEESIYAREQEALGWLEIVRMLSPFKESSLEPIALELKITLNQKEYWTLGEIRKLANFDFDKELALFYLIHCGKAKINFLNQCLKHKSVISLCH
jgi:hypothetical protein